MQRSKWGGGDAVGKAAGAMESDSQARLDQNRT